MKTIKIEERKILARTNWRDWRYCEVIQYRVSLGGKIVYCDLDEKEQKRAKIPFRTTLETRKKDDLNHYLDAKGNRSNDGKRIHEIVEKLTQSK